MNRNVQYLAWFVCLLVPFLAAAEEEKPQGNQVELGFEERVRSENWYNITDFNDDLSGLFKVADTTHQWRFRTRLWSKFSFGSKAELMIMLNNESRRVTTPPTEFKWDEVIFENLYLDYRFDDHWSARAGRQNLSRGEGFILFDGNALDGSRTAYFNALDVTYAFGKSKVELLAISNPHKDIYLPCFNDRERSLTEWDEEALGAYFTVRDFPSTSIDAYYFFKTETNDTRAPGSPGFQPDRRIHTLGERLVQELGRGWSLTAELAGQRGNQDPDTDLHAWGGYAYVKKAFPVASKAAASLGYVGLSEDWDPLFSRWPKWSELYIYTLSTETGIAYWSNLGMWRAEFLIAPWKPLDLRATYYRMLAFRPFPGDASVFADGKTRGDLVQVRADFRIVSGLSGHVVYERMSPGGFYAGGDPASFFRVELLYGFKKSLQL